MSTHPDLPDTLVHFTGRPRAQRDKPPDFALGNAEERMVNILHSGVLRGAPDFWSDAPVICFSEVTEAARRVMLRTGGGTRGPYAPWGLVLDRNRLIEAGARPVLYLSSEEMRQTRDLPTHLRNRRVRYDPGSSDWLHEREWRLCFEPGQTPDLTITPELVVGVIVGASGWMPPPQRKSLGDPVSGLKKQLEAFQTSIRTGKFEFPGAIQQVSFSASAMRTKYAGAADRLARWFWDGNDLVSDGVFDVRDQQMKDSLYGPQTPTCKINWSLEIVD